MLTSFLSLVWKCHYWPSVDEDYNLDIFEMTINTNEPLKEPINMELLIFKRFQMNAKDIKHFFQCRGKHESMFLTFGFLACQILSIVGSQIETKRIFSLTWILIIIKRCHLQLDNLDTLNFLNKNWPNDPRIGCKPMELIEIDTKLKDKLQEFEGTFERDEIFEIKFIIKRIM